MASAIHDHTHDAQANNALLVLFCGSDKPPWLRQLVNGRLVWSGSRGIRDHYRRKQGTKWQAWWLEQEAESLRPLLPVVIR